MKTIPVALATHRAGQTTTLATCWKVTLKSGDVLGFTSHDRDLIVDGVTYRAAEGYTPTNVATSSELNVDNMEVHGALASPSITENDLRAGIWDYAAVSIFEVNADSVTDGKYRVRDGRIGEVSLERPGLFKAELRGLMQAYTRNVGEVTSPACRAVLYDSRCTVDPAAWTVTGTLDSVSADGLTLFDAARTEPGPPDPVDIVAISNANPGHVTFSGTLDLAEGQTVVMSEIVGPIGLNGMTTIRNPVAGGFDLPIDTSNTTDYPAYVSGGKVRAFGEAGFFDFGTITITSGDNTGLSMEVKAYVPGQWTLALAFPYALVGTETYTMRAGCSKDAYTACRDKFDNILNFRGEPHLRGNDQLMQVGRHG